MKVPAPRKLKSGTWFIQLRLNGRSVPVSAATAKECTRQAALIKAEHQSGKRPIRAVSVNPTLKEAMDAYIDKRKNVLSPSTIRGYRTIQKNRFPDYIDTHLTKIDWRKACNEEFKNCSAKTLKNAWNFVVPVLNEYNMPIPKVSLPQVVQNTHPFLDPEQIKIFVSAVKTSEAAIPALLALSSLRRSEIAALSWDKVDLENELIRVEGATVYDEHEKKVSKIENKNTSSRRIIPILMPELLTALTAVEDKTGLVVRQAPNTLRRQVNRICAANNLPLVGAHGLRHSFASLAYHLGMSEMETMEIGGWSDINVMRKIYTHLSQIDRLKGKSKMKEFYKNQPETINFQDNAN